MAKRSFEVQGCASCHPLGAAGHIQAVLFDSLGRPIVAPNLTSDLFRGGNSRDDIYTRIVVGIPGTPHPASVLSQEEVQTLTEFVHAAHAPLAGDQTARAARLTNYQREAISLP